MGKHYADKEVVAMIGLRGDYNNLYSSFNDFLYLADVDDSFIYANYKDVLASEAHSTLEGLSVDLIKLYFDMKQRAVLENFKVKEEEKKEDESTPPNPVVGLTSLVESLQRK